MPPHDPGALQLLDSSKLQMGESMILTVLHLPAAHWIEGREAAQKPTAVLTTVSTYIHAVLITVPIWGNRGIVW